MLGVVVLTKGVVGTRAVDRGWTALHEERDADGLGRFLLGSARAGCTPGVGSNAAIALGLDGQRQGDEFLHLRTERTFGHSAGVQFLETGVDIRDRLAQVAGEGSEGLLDSFSVLVLSML